MTGFSAEIEGRKWQIKTTRDLEVITGMAKHPELSCIRTDEGREQLRNLLTEYEAAGSPQLEVTNEVKERILRHLRVTLALGKENVERKSLSNRT